MHIYVCIWALFLWWLSCWCWTLKTNRQWSEWSGRVPIRKFTIFGNIIICRHYNEHYILWVYSPAETPVVLPLTILILALIHRSNSVFPWQFILSSFDCQRTSWSIMYLRGYSPRDLHHSQCSPSVYLHEHSYLHTLRHFLLMSNLQPPSQGLAGVACIDYPARAHARNSSVFRSPWTKGSFPSMFAHCIRTCWARALTATTSNEGF